MSMSVLYVPIGRKTFDLEAGEVQRQKSSEMLKELEVSLIEPEGILTSPDELKDFLKTVQKEKVVTTIYQSVTFADGEFVETLIKEVDAPVVVWSIREPSINGRLRLNSLTGGNSTSHVLKCANHPFSFLFGNPEEAQIRGRLTKHLKVQKVINDLKQFKVGVIGEHPPGFFFSGTNDDLLHKQLGVEVKEVDLMKAFEESKKLTEEEWEHAVDRAEKQVIGLNRNDETVQRFAQFTTYVESIIKKESLTGLAIRCWPEFFNELGAAACSTLSQFTEDGIVSACESDIHGSVSMFILQQLSGGKAPYLGDMVHVNEASNSVVFWHCGAGAYSLAHPDQGAKPGVHPNRKLGFTMEFGLKPGQVTMFRVGYTPEGFRLLVMRGNALDTPKRFNGTSVEVELETEINETLYSLMEEGFEPHYALVYEDVADELVELGRQLGLETIVYKNE
ncbi:sulfoquinovose isomerase [Halobacillus mangrovi]|uniref:sulfoquinovose isomerase n=1 Tax=Halobacillus mangrovi TaxID=402384 RepID=UPI003D95F3A8